MAKSRTKRRSTKYVFVVGGVMSGVGKGVSASAIALLLKSRGLNVTAVKIDPYINVDAGTMNPTEHGEVFVLKDGLETDQDMGNYERFLEQSLPRVNYMTTGSVYLSVIEQERRLAFKGKNVEVVPDIPLEVIRRIKLAASTADADIVMIEIGGTVGEYQNILFLEAIRMLKQESPEDVATVMVSYLPVPGSIGEMKTKPTQTAVRTLNSAGVFADIIVARSPVAIDQKRKDKIATFCNVKSDHVISAPDLPSIYDIPFVFEADGLSSKLCRILNIKTRTETSLTSWKNFINKTKSAKREVKIAVVGKYFNSGDFIMSDVYLSVLEALKYSSYHKGYRPVLTYLSASDFTRSESCRVLGEYDGILVPGGFGETGIIGKLNVIRYARENKIPYFGICYGMQLMVVEFARNLAGLKSAHTTEVDADTPYPVIAVMGSQSEIVSKGQLGGTMRLGDYPAKLVKGSIAHKAYGKDLIIERHRHRYEVNYEYVDKLSQAGLVFSGMSPDGRLMEIAELPKNQHPFMVGVQFHPELIARPLNPHPLFSAFIKAAVHKK
jgi:CTP synthase